MKFHILILPLIILNYSESIFPCERKSKFTIVNSSTILLITVSNHKMKVKELIKGDKDLVGLVILNFPLGLGWTSGLSFDNVDSKYNYENHFNDHTDKKFWENRGRSLSISYLQSFT